MSQGSSVLVDPPPVAPVTAPATPRPPAPVGASEPPASTVAQALRAAGDIVSADPHPAFVAVRVRALSELIGALLGAVRLVGVDTGLAAPALDDEPAVTYRTLAKLAERTIRMDIPLDAPTADRVARALLRLSGRKAAPGGTGA